MDLMRPRPTNRPNSQQSKCICLSCSAYRARYGKNCICLQVQLIRAVGIWKAANRLKVPASCNILRRLVGVSRKDKTYLTGRPASLYISLFSDVGDCPPSITLVSDVGRSFALHSIDSTVLTNSATGSFHA